MRRLPSICILVFLVLAPAFAGRAGAAKYAGEPFSLGVGAQALALGGAFSALAADVTAGFWNPSGLSDLSGRQVGLMHAETFGALLNHDYLAVAIPFHGDRPRTGAISLTRLGGGGIKITRFDEQHRPVVVKEESHADYQLSLAYAFRQTERLDLGASVKMIYRDIPTSGAYGLGADLGAKYAAARYLTVALVLRDFTSTLLAYDNGTKESIYPTAVSGLLLHTAWRDFGLAVTADGDWRFENLRETAQFWQGSFSLDTHVGLQVGYRDCLFARGGSDRGRLALGAGLSVAPVQLDFAFLKDNDLDDSFRLSLLLAWK